MKRTRQPRGRGPTQRPKMKTSFHRHRERVDQVGDRMTSFLRTCGRADVRTCGRANCGPRGDAGTAWGACAIRVRRSNASSPGCSRPSWTVDRLTHGFLHDPLVRWLQYALLLAALPVAIKLRWSRPAPLGAERASRAPRRGRDRKIKVPSTDASSGAPRCTARRRRSVAVVPDPSGSGDQGRSRYERPVRSWQIGVLLDEGR